MGIDFADTPVSVVSIWPGFVLTDMIRNLPEEHRSEQLKAMLPDFESPEFTGLVIAALLDDPDLKSRSGRAFIGAHLGRHYAIRDLDGRQPRDWSAMYGEPLEFFAPALQADGSRK
jgi:NAD(P)-dependent dehydrogenase (short-subunit alcohol dehydrogenase family)